MWEVREERNMYKVERAIIMAAGLGNRMHPVTLTTPKPLVRVNGIRMIDTVIAGLHQNGIREIYVVVGYLKEQFAGLEDEYPGLNLIDNPYFDSCNNIASLYVARNYIENAIILDGDQIIYNPAILTPEFERSGYNSVWTDEETDEWLQTVENGVVTACSRTGGKGGWQLYSISRWTAEDGQKLRHHLEVEFEQKRTARSTGMMWPCFATRRNTDWVSARCRKVTSSKWMICGSWRHWTKPTNDSWRWHNEYKSKRRAQ